MRKIILSSLLLFGTVMAADLKRDSTNNVVIDYRTNLMWQDDNDAKTIQRNWSDAIDYCENSTLAGYSDWRLPTYHELYTIVDRSNSDPDIIDVFVNTGVYFGGAGSYWSSSTRPDNISWALYITFNNNITTSTDKSGSICFIRCVRDN